MNKFKHLHHAAPDTRFMVRGRLSYFRPSRSYAWTASRVPPCCAQRTRHWQSMQPLGPVCRPAAPPWMEVSLLSDLTTRFSHACVFDFEVRHCAIPLKPVVEMLVVLIGGDPSRPQARAPRTLNQRRHRSAPSVAWQASMPLQCESKSISSASRRPG